MECNTGVKKKSFLSTVVLTSLFAMVPLRFYAQNFEAGGLSYEVISPNEVAVCSCTVVNKKMINIPESVEYLSEQYRVTSIAEKAFFQNQFLTDIVLPNSIRKIEDNAFAYSFSLSKFNFPDSLEYIGESAFASCNASDTIEIPAAVRHIGYGAFVSNKNLKWIGLDQNNRFFITDNGVLFTSDKSQIVAFPAGREGDYEIPYTVTIIRPQTFSGAKKLTSVKIPYSVTEIGKSVFSHCSSLPSIDIPPSIISIGEQAFAFCSSLHAVNIPASVQEIAKEAFLNCVSMKSVEIPASIKVINERTFTYCTSLERVNIKSATVNVIDKMAFSYCTNLKELSLSASVVGIGHAAFYACKKLSDIWIHHINPLNLNGYVFSDVDKNSCKVHVPVQSVQKYKEANEWKDFKNIVPEQYRFAVYYSDPVAGKLIFTTGDRTVKNGDILDHGAEIAVSLHCDKGYEFDMFTFNGTSFRELPSLFVVQGEITIEVKLKKKKQPNNWNIYLSEHIVFL